MNELRRRPHLLAARVRALLVAASMGALAFSLLLLAVGARAAAPNAISSLLAWPGPAPCNTSLQACVTGAGAGDTIQIAAGTFTITSAVVVNKPLTLTGAGLDATILQPQPLNGQRVFSLTSGIAGPVTIANLTVRQAASPGPGAALIAGSGTALILKTTAFRSNVTTGGQSGGAMFVQGPTTLRNSEFTNNLSGGSGGAIQASDALTVFGGLFRQNHSFNPGGAIRVGGVAFISGTAFLTNSAGIVVANPAAVSGGALRLDGPSTVQSVVLQAGEVGNRGGGLYATAPLTLAGVLVQDSRAGDGGGIAAEAGLVATSLTLRGNRATNRGGGLFASLPISIVDSRFELNESEEGGGIFAVQSANLNAVTLLGNRARSGGGVWLDQGGAFVDGTATNNQAVGVSGVVIPPAVPAAGGDAAGGAILTRGPLTVRDAELAGNLALGGAGGSDFATGLSGGTASGGAIAGVSPTATVSLDNVDMAGNHATGGAGGFASAQSGPGGAAYGGALAAPSLNVTGGEFKQNEAVGGRGGAGGEAHGGAARIGDDAVIVGGTWLSNIAQGGSPDASVASTPGAAGGGAIWARGAVSLTTATFESNGALGGDQPAALGMPGGAGGGAVKATVVIVRGGLFRSNRATGGAGPSTPSVAFAGQGAGGAILALGQVSVDTSHFDQNSANGIGGAISIGPAELIDSTVAGGSLVANALFTSNSAQAAGRGDTLAMLLPDGGLLLAHNTIDHASPALNAAVYVNGTEQAPPTDPQEARRIDNNIFVNVPIGIERAGGPLSASSNLFYSVTAPTSGTIALGPVLTGNPRFVNRGAGDYRIFYTSPARDAGIDSSVNTDFEGQPRPQESGFDIGRDEGGVPIAPAFTTSPPLQGRLGADYVYEARASGAPPPTFTLMKGPPGMTVDPVIGSVRFLPEQAGAYSVVLRADNPAPGFAEQSWTITVPQPVGEIEGSVYVDQDANGGRGPGEPAAAGITVTVQFVQTVSGAGSAPGSATATRAVLTDAAGSYQFAGLLVGVHDVRVVAPPGFVSPPTRRVVVNPYQTTTVLPLGLAPVPTPTPTPTSTPSPPSTFLPLVGGK